MAVKLTCGRTLGQLRPADHSDLIPRRWLSGKKCPLWKVALRDHRPASLARGFHGWNNQTLRWESTEQIAWGGHPRPRGLMKRLKRLMKRQAVWGSKDCGLNVINDVRLKRT